MSVSSSRSMRIAIVAVLTVTLLAPVVAQARTLTVAESVAGKFILDVEGSGTSWYVNPATKKRAPVTGSATDPRAAIAALAVGISDADIARIPLGLGSTGFDGDKDGIPDDVEAAIGTDKNRSDTDGDSYIDGAEINAGYDPNGAGKMKVDATFAHAQKGRIFIQAKSHGQLWWVNPGDGKRYFIGSQSDAFALLRRFGVGVSKANLNAVVVGTTK